MKLERLHESLLMSVVLVGGLSMAVAAGSLAGSGRLGMVGMIVGGIILTGLLLFLRERIWVVIPAVWMLGGRVELLPLPFSVAHLGIMFAFGAFLMLKAFKIIRLKPKWSLVEVWLLVVLLYLATVFLRNPVGVEALGSERVGGRPYFNVAIACAAFWVLARSVVASRDAFLMPILAVAGNAVQAGINIVADLFPSTLGSLSKVYSGITALEELEATDVVPGEGGRRNYLLGIGSSSILAACARWRPFTIINPLYPLRFLVFLTGMMALFLSGFRTGLVTAFLTFLLASYFRRGVGEVVKALIPAVLGIGLLVAAQGTIINLPWGAQRALSFLPGKWDHAAKSDAEGSTEWRVYMWKNMLIGNRYIENKWLGDGFGFTRQQYQIMAANRTSGSWADTQENFMITGGVHSGPVSTIRFVGYVGLALFLPLLVLVAVRGWRLIRRSEGTPFYPLALFIGIPAILHPPTFVFIFGAYEGDLPIIILAIGFQKMLENSLDAYEAKPKEAITAVHERPRFRRPPQLAPVR